MWFKNLRVFRLDPAWSCTAQNLEEALRQQAFAPTGSQDMQSLGWVPPVADGPLVHALEGQYLLALRTEKKLLPATVINQFTRARAQEIEEEQGYRPGRRQMREIKEDITQELLPKAFSIFRDTRVWLDTRHHWLVIDAAAVATSDEIISLLAKALTPFPVLPLQVAQSPAAAMTAWLMAQDAPAGFTIDQEAELRSSGEDRAVVRYVRHSVDSEDVRKHVESGKQCTRLALTWADRVAFVLTENLEIRRIAALDILKEDAGTESIDEAERFDADFALMTAELAGLLDALVHALGGEQQS